MNIDRFESITTLDQLKDYITTNGVTIKLISEISNKDELKYNYDTMDYLSNLDADNYKIVDLNNELFETYLLDENYEYAKYYLSIVNKKLLRNFMIIISIRYGISYVFNLTETYYALYVTPNVDSYLKFRSFTFNVIYEYSDKFNIEDLSRMFIM